MRIEDVGLEFGIGVWHIRGSILNCTLNPSIYTSLGHQVAHSFTPVSTIHPHTKRFVDSRAAAIWRSVYSRIQNKECVTQDRTHGM